MSHDELQRSILTKHSKLRGCTIECSRTGQFELMAAAQGLRKGLDNLWLRFHENASLPTLVEDPEPLINTDLESQAF